MQIYRIVALKDMCLVITIHVFFLPTDSASGILGELTNRLDDCSTFIPFVLRQATSTNTNTTSTTSNTIPTIMNTIASGEILTTKPGGDDVMSVPALGVEVGMTVALGKVEVEEMVVEFVGGVWRVNLVLLLEFLL